MPHLTLRDGVRLFYKDWGSKTGPVVVLSHGWPLNSDDWQNQMFFLANNGCRVIAHDRRGHGRSDQPWDGNDLDTWADDLAQLIEHLDLKDILIAGHSTGGGEITRYCSRHGTSRVKKLVLISAITPQLVKTDDNPNGVPIEVLDHFRAEMTRDRAAFFYEVPKGPFFGFNRPGAKASQGLIDAWWTAGMQASLKSTYDTTFSWEASFKDELKALDIPVMIIHGTDDQIVPFAAGGEENLKYLKHATLKVYDGGAHALPNTEIAGINEDLLNFRTA